MEDFFSKDDYTPEDIQRLIDDNMEETLNLEFKAAAALDGSNREIAKDVSAFANSAGGIIIYGIKEEDHKASKLSFVDGNKHDKEKIENIINSLVIRKIPDLKIYPIRFDDKIEQTVYLIKIPESPLAPHMVYNKYYKRYNFSAAPMEEYEVRSLYHKVNTGVLEISLPRIATIKAKTKTEGVINFMLEIKNIGHAAVKDYKLELLIPKLIFSKFAHVLGKYTEEDVIENPLFPYLTHQDNETYRFLIPGKEIIFGGESLKLIDCHLLANDKHLEEKIKLKLFSSSGIKEQEYTLEWLMRMHRVEKGIRNVLEEYIKPKN